MLRAALASAGAHAAAIGAARPTFLREKPDTFVVAGAERRWYIIYNKGDEV